MVRLAKEDDNKGAAALGKFRNAKVANSTRASKCAHIAFYDSLSCLPEMGPGL